VIRFDADVAIVGAGPAGATAALRLASIGHSVVIVEAAPFPRTHVGESLTSRVVELFDLLGVREQMESAGFLRPCGAMVHWAGETRLREDFAEGFQVDRARFDAILLGAAIRHGARILQPSRVAAVRRLGCGGWTLKLGAGETELHVRFLVDAAGRRGCLPGAQRINLQPVTIALYGYWTNTGITGAETRVEAGGGHWYWGAPLPDGSVNASVFISPRLRAERRCRALRDLYLQLLTESRLLSECLRGSLRDSVRACDATASRTLDVAGDDWIRIGEAALAFDPLSSQGVQNAIAGGFQGAAVAHTLLMDIGMREAAIELARDRVREGAESHTATLNSFYRAQAKVAPRPFWLDRAEDRWCTPHPAATEVAPALTPDTPLHLDPATNGRQRPVLAGDRIVSQPALQLPGRRPVAWLEGEELTRLCAVFEDGPSAQQVLEHWSARYDRPRAAGILSMLWKERFLRSAAA